MKGTRTTPGSGCFVEDPGDVVGDAILLDDKYTDDEVFYLTKAMWKKHARDAEFRQQKMPVFRINVTGLPSVAVLTLAEWSELSDGDESNITISTEHRGRRPASIVIRKEIVEAAVEHGSVTFITKNEKKWAVVEWTTFVRAHNEYITPE